jgi:hypothetical protein
MVTETLKVTDRLGRMWQVRRRAAHMDWYGRAFDDRIRVIGPAGEDRGETDIPSRGYLLEWLEQRMDPAAIEQLGELRPEWLPDTRTRLAS